MKKLLVIGGGFAGSLIARRLENNFKLILIDTKDYFEYTPSVLRVIVEPEKIRRIQVKHKDYLKKSEILIGEVGEISDKYVLLAGKKIFFDYLCICSGSKYSLPIKEQNVILSSRAENLRRSHFLLEKNDDILIIGGGLVGVELAAEICSHYKDKRIKIVLATDRIIERNHEKSISYAENFLKKNRVEIMKNERIIDSECGQGIYHSESGKKIKTDMAFLCTGAIPNFEFMLKNFKNKINEKNQIKVDEFLRLEGEKNIFVAGDINSISIEKTAQNAEHQANIVIDNIIAIERKLNMKKYILGHTPMIISLGKWDGIFEYKNLVITGIIPALMKKFIEFREMFKIRYL